MEFTTMILRSYAAGLRAGESIDEALLGAALKAIRERASGVPTEREALMNAFRSAAREEAERLGLGDAEREP